MFKVKQTTSLTGLDHFVLKDASHSEWSNWRRWPHLSVAIDQGSDGVASYWWLQSVGASLTVYWDFSHGCMSDWKNMLKDVDMWSFGVLMMCVWNAPCGPLADRTRWQQLLESWGSMFKHFSAKTCPLFQDKVLPILHERGAYAAMSSSSGDVEDMLWEELKVDPPSAVARRRRT